MAVLRLQALRKARIANSSRQPAQKTRQFLAARVSQLFAALSERKQRFLLLLLLVGVLVSRASKRFSIHGANRSRKRSQKLSSKNRRVCRVPPCETNTSASSSSPSSSPMNVATDLPAAATRMVRRAFCNFRHFYNFFFSAEFPLYASLLEFRPARARRSTRNFSFRHRAASLRRLFVRLFDSKAYEAKVGAAAA